jgi:hypothetical protein
MHVENYSKIYIDITIRTKTSCRLNIQALAARKGALTAGKGALAAENGGLAVAK